MLAALNHQAPDRVPIDLGGNQTGIHKFAYQALLEHLGIADQLVIMDAVQQLARPCEAAAGAVPRGHPLHRRQGGRPVFRGGIEQNRRDGRLWHDLRDEFGVVWSMPDDRPYYMDISHHPLAEATIGRYRRLPVPQGRRSQPVRGPARAGPGDAERHALRGGQRHFRRGVRNLLVHARPGTLVHGPGDRSRSSARPCSTRR